MNRNFLQGAPIVGAGIREPSAHHEFHGFRRFPGFPVLTLAQHRSTFRMCFASASALHPPNLGCSMPASLSRFTLVLFLAAQLLVACATGVTTGGDDETPATRDGLDSPDPVDGADQPDTPDAGAPDTTSDPETGTDPGDSTADAPEHSDIDLAADAFDDADPADSADAATDEGDATDDATGNDAHDGADAAVADADLDTITIVDASELQDTTQPPPSLDSVLGDLDADLEGTLHRFAWSDGWPLTLDDGTVLLVTTDTSLTSVAGEFNAWAQLPMVQRGSFRWARVTAVSGGYKFTDGTRWIADPSARHYTFDENGEMSLMSPSTAHLQRYPDMECAGLLPRTIRVWVPASTVTHTLYMHDGQNLFDPRAPFGTWGVQSRAPAGLMVVGIDNTPDRMSDYTHVTDNVGGMVGGNADRYARCIVDELRPWVDEQFGEAERVGVMGSSLGGLVSLLILHQFPDGWDFVGSMSGTVGWGKIAASNPTVLDLLGQPAFDTDAVIYIDSGGGADNCADNDGDGMRDDGANNRDNYCENLQLRDLLADRGFVFNTNLFHWHEPNAAHNEAAWSARLARPLQIFMDL